MSTTLWVCLTCGFVGCGRYTQKHAAQHNALNGHPYSLELATGRIWDYENGTFVHRRDLVECPVLSVKWGIANTEAAGRNTQSSLIGESLGFLGGDGRHVGLDDLTASCHSANDQFAAVPDSKLAQPKKSIMISEEYEALLQSALQDQSQHYEGEISHLRAELASSRLERAQITDRESREIDALKKDSQRLKQEAEKMSSVLLEAQTMESKHRSMSQRLLREQSIAKELLDKIRRETIAEHESGKQRMEDLEMQISDLTANMRMMSEFANNEELSQAQIFGTIGGEKKPRGKKSRRGGRKK